MRMQVLCGSSVRRSAVVLLAFVLALGRSGLSSGLEIAGSSLLDNQGLPDQHLWELINVGNGYFQIRLKSAEGFPKQCLGVIKETNKVRLLDCPAMVGKPAQWSFDRLAAGGYQVLNNWSDFYQRPACLGQSDATAPDIAALRTCRYGQGRTEGILQLYADPTAPLNAAPKGRTSGRSVCHPVHGLLNCAAFQEPP